jgi:FlaA1/EpsC-like NDP-sugar epimerase
MSNGTSIFISGGTGSFGRHFASPFPGKLAHAWMPA